MRRYGFALLILWTAGAAAATIYAGQRDIPVIIAAPVALAMLLELSFYAGLAFSEVREWAAARENRLLGVLFVTVLAPYYLSLAQLNNTFWGQIVLALVIAPTGAWFFFLPHRRIFDAGLLVFMAAVYMSGVFEYIYPPPIEGLDIEILGKLMWIRLGITLFLIVRREDGTGFGFWPEHREWRIGLQHYAMFLPLGAVLIYLLDFARFAPATGAWWQAPAMFFAFLWVVALGEEFFFRGLLQRWLSEAVGQWPALVAASLAFGAVHLPFREFPNWKFATLATVAGFFYGRAFQRGGGIRAAMVTHALVVTTWRTLLR